MCVYITYKCFCFLTVTAFHDLLLHNLKENLTDHDSKLCIACNRDALSNKTDSAGEADDLIVSQKRSSSDSKNDNSHKTSFMDKFSSAFKFKVGDYSNYF